VRWAGAAITDDRTVPQRQAGLAWGWVQPLQDKSEPTTGFYPPTAGYTDLEAWGVAEMSLMPEGSPRAAGAND